MKIRFSSLLNDLNITLDTAKERLKKSGMMDGRKVYTLNTVVSEEEIKILSSYQQILRENTIHKTSNKKNHCNKNKTSQSPISPQMHMTCGHSFTYCATHFNKNSEKIEEFADIKKELVHIFGNDMITIKLPLFKTMEIKGNNVYYKYYYYAMNGHKVNIKHSCIATWLACIISEAVNQKKMLKADYKQIFKTYLWKPIQSTKMKSVKRRKRPWVSVVSVPFGGMNR